MTTSSGEGTSMHKAIRRPNLSHAANTPPWKALVGIGLVAIGLAMLVGSALAPDAWLRPTGWDVDRARSYQRASADLHQLSVAAEGTAEDQQRLREARVEFADLELQRAAIEASAGWRRGLLQWGGFTLALLGALVPKMG